MSSKDVIFLPNILDIEMEKSQTEYKGVCLLCVCVCVCVCVSAWARVWLPILAHVVIPRKKAPIKPLQMTSS